MLVMNLKYKLLIQFYIKNKNVSKVHGCPTHTIIFHVQWTVKLGKKSNLAIKLERLYHRECVLSFKLIGLQLHQKLP